MKINDSNLFKHGEEGTHGCCNTRLKKEGGKARCCVCVPHEGCDDEKPSEEARQLGKENCICAYCEHLREQCYIEKIKVLIVKEINTAQLEGEKTSRLTSLYTALSDFLRSRGG